MKKRMNFLLPLLAVLLVLPLLMSACGSQKSSQKDTTETYTSSTYIHEYSELNTFTIQILTDGTYQYSESKLSSYVGIGTWTKDGDVITLHDIREVTDGDNTAEKEFQYRFRMTQDSLIFLADGSDEFSCVHPADGDVFDLIWSVDIPKSDIDTDSE